VDDLSVLVFYDRVLNGINERRLRRLEEIYNGGILRKRLCISEFA